jgi:hypothetical protein
MKEYDGRNKHVLYMKRRRKNSGRRVYMLHGSCGNEGASARMWSDLPTCLAGRR